MPRHEYVHRTKPLRRLVLFALACIFATAITACASGGVVDKGLEIVGLKKIEPPTMPTELPAGMSGDLPTLNGQIPGSASQRQIALRIHAGQVLNIDPSGRSLALVVRIYKLRGTSQFVQTTYPMFAASTGEKPLQGDEVILSKEIVLVPGQKYEMVEPMPRDASHLAVVALFRSPDALRWRFVFEARAATKTGVTLGAHGCALSVAVGEPVGAQPDALRLAGVQCS